MSAPRSWDVDEEYFAASLANIVCLALNQWERKRAEQALWQSLAERKKAEQALQASEAARRAAEMAGTGKKS